MKPSISKIFFAFVLIVFLPARGQDQLYPKITENNQEFYLYQVSQGEGLWSISKKFEVSQNELHQYNPELAQGLRYGITLKIPVRKQVFQPKQQNKSTESGEYKTHIVEPSQTLYSIAKMYNVSIGSIIALNASARDGLKVGEELKIPISNQNIETKEDINNDTSVFILHEVKRKETLYSISKQYGVDINSILESNDIKDVIKKGDVLRIFKRHGHALTIQKNDNIVSDTAKTEVYDNDKYADTISNVLRVAIMLPFKLDMAGADKNAEKFVDFYRGVLLAIDAAKKQGTSSILYVYDTGNSENDIDSLLTKEELQHVDLIIGPAYTNQIQKVTDFAKQHQTFVVIPFSQNVKDLGNNPYIIQFNPPKQMFLTISKGELLKKFKNRHILLAYFENNDDEGNNFANALLADLLVTNTPHSRCFITEENADSICESAVSQHASILLASSTPERVKPILRKINQYRIGTDLELIGFDRWGLSLLTESKPIYFTSLFNPYSKFALQYKTEYEKYFGIANNAYPNYDQLGYDIMCNMIEMLKEKRVSNNLTFPELNNVQSDMKFKKIMPDGGWVNEHVYLIHLE